LFFFATLWKTFSYLNFTRLKVELPACYPEHGLPLLLYLAKNHNLDVETTLLANANAGGDNVHRGMILGLIVGAASDERPEHLLHGLIAFEELQKEIEEFSDIALSGKGI